ncbi:MAG: SUMF1/EgtB/PvdO family nonheme iron enzyme, partial [Verrucomicrobiota bacterium]
SQRTAMMLRKAKFVFAIVAGLAALGLAGREASRLAEQRQVAQEYEPPPPGMVFVPAGEFLMGSDDPEAEPDERPLRKVFVPAFYIDRHEVTNREYKQFKPDYKYPAGQDDMPVTFVLKPDAEAYCRFIGKRLPTGAEWEKAARGADGRRYPWGNEFNPAFCNLRKPAAKTDPDGKACLLPNANERGKLPPGSFPQGASPYGCQDMAGNVWEWVSDNFYDRGMFGFKSGEPRGVIRGGAYGYSSRQGRASYQGLEALNTTCHDVGFRCAMTAVAKK